MLATDMLTTVNAAAAGVMPTIIAAIRGPTRYVIYLIEYRLRMSLFRLHVSYLYINIYCYGNLIDYRFSSNGDAYYSTGFIHVI